MYPNNSDDRIFEINITPKRVYEKKKGHFLKGPIPMPWLIVAGNLPGKALHVGIALWSSTSNASQNLRKVILPVLRSGS